MVWCSGLYPAPGHLLK